MEIDPQRVTTESGLDKDYSDTGDTVFFDISVRNTGNTRLSQVVVELLDDTFGDTATITCDRNYSSVSSRFVPSSQQPGGHPIMCEVSKVLSSADVDAGTVNAMAEVSQSVSQAVRQSS